MVMQCGEVCILMFDPPLLSPPSTPAAASPLQHLRQGSVDSAVIS